MFHHAVCCCLLLALAAAVPAQDTVPDEAELQSEFKRAELNPQARVAITQGLEFLKAKDSKKAINAFRSAVKMHPNNGQFRHLLGLAHYRAKDGGQAWLQFRKAVILSPRYTPAIRDFEATWAMFQKRDVFAIGRPQTQIANFIGEPDAKAQDDRQEVWQYGFMRLQFVQGRLVTVVDPRGLSDKDARPVDSLTVEFDDKERWKLGSRSVNRLHAITEYVPKDQNVRQWRELLQIQRLINMASQRTPEQLMRTIEEKLKAADPSVQLAVLSLDDQEALFHWNSPGAKGKPAQHEIVRIVKGERDLHRLAYTRGTPQIPQAEAQQWLDLLRKAELKRSAVQSFAAPSE